MQFAESFSKVPWQKFPGGMYKASTNSTLKTTTIAGKWLQDLAQQRMLEMHLMRHSTSKYVRKADRHPLPTTVQPWPNRCQVTIPTVQQPDTTASCMLRS